MTNVWIIDMQKFYFALFHFCFALFHFTYTRLLPNMLFLYKFWMTEYFLTLQKFSESEILRDKLQ